MVDSAVRGGHVSDNSSIAFCGCSSVRSISSVAAIGGRGLVGLLQSLLELLGLLVVLGFCGVGFATGVQNVENDNDSVNKKQDYESKYNEEEAKKVKQQQAEEKRKLQEMQE